MISSEFFTSDLPCVPDIIFQEPDLMRYFFSFVTGKGPLNFLLSGYFFKAYECCLNHNNEELLMIIFQEGYHLALLKHIRSSSISEIVSSIISSKSRIDGRKEILEGVITLLGSTDYMTSFNAAQILLRISKEEEIFHLCLVEQNFEAIFNFLQSKEIWIIRNAGNVIKYILNSFGEDVAPFLTSKIGLLTDVLQRESESTIPTSFGLTIKAFGEDKLIILELCSILCNFPVLHSELPVLVDIIVSLFPDYI